MQEEDYTFVTLDSEDTNLSEAVILDVDGENDLSDIVMIDEGIEVLTGVPAGKKDKDGHFPAGTVNYMVYEKLKKYAKISSKD